MSSRIARGITLALAIALVLVTHPIAEAVPQDAAPLADVRGLWVLRTSMTSPASIAAVVRTAVEGGYNTLLVQVRSRGEAYYASEIDPRAAELAQQPKTFDPLAVMLTTAHAAGLKVHAWVNVNFVSSAVALPTSKNHVAAKHPEWLMVPRALAAELHRLDPASPAYVNRLARWTRGQQDSVEGLYLSPATDEAQDYTVGVIRSIAKSYPLDGIHLDYIRYPSEEFDYSAAALRAFRAGHARAVEAGERERLDRASRADPLVWARSYPEAWTTFRTERLTTLVKKVRTAVKTARPKAVLSSAVIPDPADARDAHFQNWEGWADSGLLDVVCPMAYSTMPAAFADQVASAVSAAHGQPVWMGIGAWRLPVAQTAAHVATARRAGVEGVLLFSYDSLLTAVAPRGSYFTRLRSTLLNPRDR
jgi:uncharacterized lipoprotein YddW (UPF0748 family)